MVICMNVFQALYWNNKEVYLSLSPSARQSHKADTCRTRKEDYFIIPYYIKHLKLSFLVQSTLTNWVKSILKKKKQSSMHTNVFLMKYLYLQAVAFISIFSFMCSEHICQSGWDVFLLCSVLKLSMVWQFVLQSSAPSIPPERPIKRWLKTRQPIW